MRSIRLLWSAGILWILVAGPSALAADWPQWRGPRRDAVAQERGLLKAWPPTGPRLLWQMSGLGTGFSSPAITGNRLYTMGDIELGGRKQQCILAIDLTTRKRVWAAPVGRPHEDGPRCTPTVAGGRVYAIGTEGFVVAVDAASGKELWRVHMERDLGGRMMSGWRYSESPLVDGNRVVVTPGMPSSTMVALDAKTGKKLWTCAAGNIGGNGTDGAGYSSAVPARVGSVQLYVQQYGRGVIGVEAATGRLLWSYTGVANSTANIMTPIVQGDLVFVSNAYGSGSACLKMTAQGNNVRVSEVYRLPANVLQNHHGGLVAVGGYVYGGHGQNRGQPTCIELNTGKVMWQSRAPASGSAAVLAADGMLYFRYDNGLLALIHADPTGYRLASSFQVPTARGPAWAHPVIVDGRLYLRHDDILLCYEVAAQRKK